jgi:hypothetical protein
VLLSTEPPAGTSGSSQVFDVTIRAKTPQTAVYLRDCNPPATPIPCGTDQPVTERTSRSFEFMVASVRPNPAALPFALDVTWTAVTGP